VPTSGQRLPFCIKKCVSSALGIDQHRGLFKARENQRQVIDDRAEPGNAHKKKKKDRNKINHRILNSIDKSFGNLRGIRSLGHDHNVVVEVTINKALTMIQK
jgi:hypothetical protein